MERENLRFEGLHWYNKYNPETVVIGGAGGIGSWTAFFLARANFNVILYDFDKVEEHNLGGQFFKLYQIHRYKTEAVYENIKDFVSNNISANSIAFTEDSPTHEFMISAFDSMIARKIMFDVWKKSWNEMKKPLLIDGRLNAEHFQIFCVTPETADLYKEKFLFDDSEAPSAACTMQQTTHTAAMIASHITGFFTNHISNIYLRDSIRELPFLYEYMIPMNLTNDRYENL